MAEASSTSPGEFTVTCARCEGPVLAQRAWAGLEVQCPHCSSVIRVPQPSDDGKPLRSEAPSLSPRRNFNFACSRCESLLEAHTGMSGQTGRCPTCGAGFVVPYLDPRTGLPMKVDIEDDGQNPTPMHAYGASGQQAPRIVRAPDGTAFIVCPRCESANDIDANNCQSCGVPFTIEGTPTVRTIETDSKAVASLVLGIVSLPLFLFFVPAILALGFGLLSLRGALSGGTTSKQAIAGVIMGLLSLIFAILAIAL